MTVVPTQRSTAAEAAERYLAAWNARDGAEVARIVTGTYVDPTLPAPISGDDLAAYVDGLCAAFPDLNFVTEALHVDGDTVVGRWRMRGTNDGAALPGAPAPTGGSIDLPGVDVFTVDDGRLVDVVGYFDQKAFVEQLGLQTFVMPKDSWPVSFGTAMRVDLGNVTHPGAMTMTWIEVDPADDGQLTQQSVEIVTSLASDPAFIGMTTAGIGRRFYTMTLWTSPEAAIAAIGRNAPHTKAMTMMMSDSREFGNGGFTSIWQPHRVNSQFRACPECGKFVSIDPDATEASCECGGRVEATPYV